MRKKFPIWRVVDLGIKSLLLHKMRSMLTMLGIIFGVCSVIAMLAIGEGASHEAQESIKKLGSSNVILRSLKPPEDNKASGSGRSFATEYGLTYGDASRIQHTMEGIEQVVPMRIMRESVRFGQSAAPAQVIGTHPIYSEISNLEIVSGRFLSPTDEQHFNNVCVLSLSLAQKLFPYENPLSEEVRVGADYYKVVGLIREQSTADKRPQSGAMEGQPLDNAMFIPLSTARARFGDTLIRRSAGSFEAEKVQLHQITIKFKDVSQVEEGVPQIENLLSKFHKKKDFEMVVPLQLLRQAEQTKRMFNIVLGSIAAISLLVGGIGIMNIMLATVTERTREIGIRRALGARKNDIISQFLIESTVLSVGGGLIGVALGIVIPIVVSYLTDLTTIITPTALILAFTISGGIGVIFGLYPASRAAALDPIVALRRD